MFMVFIAFLAIAVLTNQDQNYKVPINNIVVASIAPSK